MNETKKIYLLGLQEAEGKYSKKRYFELSYTISSVSLINIRYENSTAYYVFKCYVSMYYSHLFLNDVNRAS